MERFLTEISKNGILWSTVIAWIIAQSIKVIIGIIKEKRFNFKWFVGTGGMPSSHVAGVSALATSVGLSFGFDSPIFAISAIFTIIIMFDAQGVRRASGKQAEILNKMIEDIYLKREIKEDKLKEFIGHTPFQVFIGAALGIFISVVFNQYF
ncbi:MAG: divergent PAP2 family protein [Candidatus Omnitrophica bacterium]|nr:divergent PAP2 family protein [Candidatus Omnitrophota bacterium]